MENNPYPYKKLLWLPFFIILFYIFYKIDDVRTDAYIKQLDTEYFLVRFKDSINDRIKEILIPKNIKSPRTSFVSTFNNKKFRIWVEPVNHELRIPEVMRVGSLVQKNKYDSLLVVKNIEGIDTLEYVYKLLNYKTLSYEPEKWEKPSIP